MTRLVRGLNYWDAFSLVAGCMIGTGIFLKTAVMTQNLHSGWLVLAAWAAAGLISVLGALTYAEVGSRFPSAGGEYVYLREAYGNLVAFLCGWTRFWIIGPASSASYAIASATFLGSVVSLDAIGGKTVLGVSLIALFSALNCFAVMFAGRINTVMTAIKVILILAVTMGIFVFAKAADPSAQALLPETIFNNELHPMNAFGLAMISALWAFDGWNSLPMAAGEVENAKVNVPKAIIRGTLAVFAIYALLNIAYFYALSPESIASSNSVKFPDSPSVATKATETFLGASGTFFFSCLFVLSTLGAMNSSILTGTRIPYAMAHDHLFFKFLGYVHPRTHVPMWSVIATGVISILLACTGSFDQLTDYVVFTSWIFYGLIGYSVYVFRKRKNSPAAAYHVPFYPWLPAFFILSSVLLLGNSLYSSFRESIIGVLLIVIGVPFYYWFNRHR